MGGIKDGHFEAACDKDFKNAELLCTVKDTPGINYNHVILGETGKGSLMPVFVLRQRDMRKLPKCIFIKERKKLSL